MQRSKRPRKLVLVATVLLLLLDVLDGRVTWRPHLALGTPVEGATAGILLHFGGAGKRWCFLPVKGAAGDAAAAGRSAEGECPGFLGNVLDGREDLLLNTVVSCLGSVFLVVSDGSCLGIGRRDWGLCGGNLGKETILKNGLETANRLTTSLELLLEIHNLEEWIYSLVRTLALLVLEKVFLTDLPASALVLVAASSDDLTSAFTSPSSNV